MSKIDLGDLERTSAEIADNLFNKAHTLEHLEEFADGVVSIPTLKPKLEMSRPAPIDTNISRPRARAVSFQKPMCGGGGDTSGGGNSSAQNSISSSSSSSSSATSDVFSVAGINLPKSTVFLIIILIVIGIALFYKTS